MRTTSLAAALVLLLAGCGLDSDPASPEDPGLTLGEPELLTPGPTLAAAAAPTNVWAKKAPMPTARTFLVAATMNGATL